MSTAVQPMLRVRNREYANQSLSLPYGGMARFDGAGEAFIPVGSGIFNEAGESLVGRGWELLSGTPEMRETNAKGEAIIVTGHTVFCLAPAWAAGTTVNCPDGATVAEFDVEGVARVPSTCLLDQVPDYRFVETETELETALGSQRVAIRKAREAEIAEAAARKVPLEYKRAEDFGPRAHRAIPTASENVALGSTPPPAPPVFEVAHEASSGPSETELEAKTDPAPAGTAPDPTAPVPAGPVKLEAVSGSAGDAATDVPRLRPTLEVPSMGADGLAKSTAGAETSPAGQYACEHCGDDYFKTQFALDAHLDAHARNLPTVRATSPAAPAQAVTEPVAEKAVSGAAQMDQERQPRQSRGAGRRAAKREKTGAGVTAGG